MRFDIYAEVLLGNLLLPHSFFGETTKLICKLFLSEILEQIEINFFIEVKIQKLQKLFLILPQKDQFLQKSITFGNRCLKKLNRLFAFHWKNNFIK